MNKYELNYEQRRSLRAFEAHLRTVADSHWLTWADKYQRVLYECRRGISGVRLHLNTDGDSTKSTQEKVMEFIESVAAIVRDLGPEPDPAKRKLVIEIELGDDAAQTNDDVFTLIGQALNMHSQNPHNLKCGDGGKFLNAEGAACEFWEVREHE